MQIYADTDEMLLRSDEVLSIRSELEKTVDQIEFLVLSLTGSWQGDAERAYESNIVYIKQIYDELSAFFAEYANVLKNCAERYAQCDTDLTSKIKLI